jgi:hypothetical protein
VTHKTFKDRQGKTWDVWQVDPKQGSHAPVAEEFSFGWLCFESADEKRRLAPVPEGWERADDDTIEQWCCIAKPVTRHNSKPERGDGGAETVQ